MIETSQNELQYIRYIEEYIPQLHIHQHSLLTRKVFFRHNFQHWSSSLYQLDHLVFKSYSSSSHHRLQVIIGSGSSWNIITGSGSSLDLDHHHWTGSGSSLDLDHYCWIIITGSGSSLDLDQHWCYLMILLVIGSSTEPALFHAGCRPTLHVGLYHL